MSRIQIASLFASVGADTKPLESGLGSAKQSLSQFGGEMAKQVIGTVSLTAAIYKTGKAVIDSIRDWTDYADSMRLSAQMAGITTEEMSRLAQAADDFRVPMETMQSAMEMALKNGFIPTIDNLATLSDRLLATADPAERAAIASKIFGKSYADIMPFLLAGGDAIRDTTESISDNLVVSEESARQAKEYKDALDALGDAWVGLKNKIGQFVVPALTDVINNLAGEPTELMKMQDAVFAAAKKAFDDGKISAEEYQGVLDGVATSTGTYTDYVDKLNFMLRILNQTNGEAADSTATLAGAESGAADAAIQAAEAQALLAEAQAKMMDELVSIVSLENVYKGIISLAYEYSDVLEQQAALQAERDNLISQGWSDQSAKVKELDANIAGLDDRMAEMADRVTLDMFEATIAVGGVTKAELAAYMQMATGMGLMSQQGAEAAIAAYGNAIETIDSYEIDDKTGNVIVDTAAAYAAFDALERYQLLDKEQRIFVRTYTDTTGGYDPYENYNGPTYGPQGATGIRAFSDMPYIVGERGPELFVPDTSGQVVPNNAMTGGSEILGEILMELQNQPARIKIAIKEAMALVGG